MLKKDDQRGNPLKEAHDNRETLIDKIKNVLSNKFVIIGILGIAVIGVTFYLGMDNSEKNMKEDYNKVKDVIEKEVESDNKRTEEVRDNFEKEMEVRVPLESEYEKARQEGRMLELEKDTGLPNKLLDSLYSNGLMEVGNEPYYELGYKLNTQKSYIRDYLNNDIILGNEHIFGASIDEIQIKGYYGTMERGFTRKSNIYYGYEGIKLSTYKGENYGVLEIPLMAYTEMSLEEIETEAKKLKPEIQGKKLEPLGEFLQREVIHGLNFAEVILEESIDGEDEYLIQNFTKEDQEELVKSIENKTSRKSDKNGEMENIAQYSELYSLNPKSDLKIVGVEYMDTGKPLEKDYGRPASEVTVHKGQIVKGYYIFKYPTKQGGRINIQIDKKTRVLGLIGDLYEKETGDVIKRVQIEDERTFYEDTLKK